MNDGKLGHCAGISCLLPVYNRDNAAHFDSALLSIVHQTRRPDQVVIVEDGPLTRDLYEVVAHWRAKLQIKSLPLPTNVGLGIALNAGVHACDFNLVIRADADDISKKNRFETLENYLIAHPQVNIAGSAIEEFQNNPGDLKRIRITACTDHLIRQYSRMRNPFNHMSVIFRKQAVLNAGNYVHRPGFEDYDLWLRLLKQPGQVANIAEPLVDVRVGNGMLSRRHGLKYLSAELQFLNSCQQRNLLSSADVIRSALFRIPARISPKGALEIIYNKLLRKTLRA